MRACSAILLLAGAALSCSSRSVPSSQPSGDYGISSPRRDGRTVDGWAIPDWLRRTDLRRVKPDRCPPEACWDNGMPKLKIDQGPYKPDKGPPPIKPDGKPCPPGYACWDKGPPATCFADADCTANPTAKYCDPIVGRCVECRANTDCMASPLTPVCQTASGTCVAWCVAWRQTGMCSATGPREPWNDKDCGASIDSGWSGFCECVFQSIGADCGHPVNTCASVCALGAW